VDPVPDPLLLIKSGSAGNRTRTSGSVARNSDRYITEAVTNHAMIYELYGNFCKYITLVAVEIIGFLKIRKSVSLLLETKSYMTVHVPTHPRRTIRGITDSIMYVLNS
jgi:hypothetical protein